MSQAPGGKDALRMFDEGRTFDLLFTDIVMPGMTERQLAEPALLRVAGMRVLDTTGYTRNAGGHDGVIDPGTHLLPKPYGIDPFVETVRSVLDGWGRRTSGGRSDAPLQRDVQSFRPAWAGHAADTCFRPQRRRREPRTDSAIDASLELF